MPTLTIFVAFYLCAFAGTHLSHSKMAYIENYYHIAAQYPNFDYLQSFYSQQAANNSANNSANNINRNWPYTYSYSADNPYVRYNPYLDYFIPELPPQFNPEALVPAYSQCFTDEMFNLKAPCDFLKSRGAVNPGQKLDIKSAFNILTAECYHQFHAVTIVALVTNIIAPPPSPQSSTTYVLHHSLASRCTYYILSVGNRPEFCDIEFTSAALSYSCQYGSEKDHIDRLLLKSWPSRTAKLVVRQVWPAFPQYSATNLLYLPCTRCLYHSNEKDPRIHMTVDVKDSAGNHIHTMHIPK